MLQPVAATMPHWSPYLAPVAAAHHSQRRALAAPGAGTGAADVDVRLLLEHHVDEQVFIDVLLVGGPNSLK